MNHRAELVDAVRRAVAAASAHPAVLRAEVASTNSEAGTTVAEITFDTNPWSSWRAQGHSPSGVRPEEVVRFDFPPDYPAAAPIPSLRRDFNRDLPHFQPFLHAGRPVPCLYDGDLGEFLHREGFLGVVVQTAHWLRLAAEDKLIAPEQGWEPVRRDSFQDSIFANTDDLRRVVDAAGGVQFRPFRYLLRGKSTGDAVYGGVGRYAIDIAGQKTLDLLVEPKMSGSVVVQPGRSVAMLLWAGTSPDGVPVRCEEYLPETVSNAAGLVERARLYACSEQLRQGMLDLRWLIGQNHHLNGFPLAVIMLVRRPLPIIGSDSPIEVCSYIGSLSVAVAGGDNTEIAVRPATHLEAMSREVLARMSTAEEDPGRPFWILFGAGSVGSKIAIHLTRAGAGPSVVVDSGILRPHNVARHALHPAGPEGPLLGAKADAVATVIGSLDQQARPVVADARAVLDSVTDEYGVLSKKPWAIVNSTASLVVRDALARHGGSARVIETALFASGEIGVVTVEGPGRNPGTADVMVEFDWMREHDVQLKELLGRGENGLSRREVGQGCGSMTMAMSDGRVSLFSAGMAEYIRQRQREGLPKGAGELLVGHLDGNGMGVLWKFVRVVPVEVVETAISGIPWSVRVHDRARTKIEEAVGQWPGVETGGVVVGRWFEGIRTFNVVDVLPAPEGSRRAPKAFELGASGGSNVIEDYSRCLDRCLDVLGTWHSHLSGREPSATDRRTAERLAGEVRRPMLSLVKASDGFAVCVADVEIPKMEVGG